MSYNLFIDDERMPPNDGNDWVIARSSQEAKDIVRASGVPRFISFDHDLGGEDTSIKFIWFLIDSYMSGYIKSFPAAYYVHSQNPVGAANIRWLMGSFMRHELKK